MRVGPDCGASDSKRQQSMDSRPSEETLQYAQGLLDRTREELVRADTKASLLLAASGVALGALLNGLISAKWSPLQLDSRVGWLWWLGLAATVLALTLLAVAIFPSTKRASTKPALAAYYGDAIGRTADELATKVTVTPHKLHKALLDQILTVSTIVARKYRLLQWAMWSFGAAIPCFALSVLTHHLLTAA